MTATRTPAITPEALADRLARAEAVTILDVRDDASWTVAAPTAAVRHVPAARVLEEPDRVARQVSGPVVTVCGRGISARPVADALRVRGVDAKVLEGGMRGWLGVLREHPVDLGAVTRARVWQIHRPARGCLSYLVIAGGRALVVDPAPDPHFYLRLASRHGARITDVVDTHLHADHLSGARALAADAGATLRLPASALERGLTGAGDLQPLHDGDVIGLGASTVRAVALPGHTTDMTGLLLDGAVLLGGDSVFADGIARPDLQRGDRAGARSMARLLHASLHKRVLPLGDDVVLLPGHTHPGVLGRAVAPRLGEVRGVVPELAIEDPSAFAEALLADTPPRPANYEAVIAVNAGTRPFEAELETGGNSCATRQRRGTA